MVAESNLRTLCILIAPIPIPLKLHEQWPTQNEKRSFIFLNIAANLWVAKNGKMVTAYRTNRESVFRSCCYSTSAVFIYRLKSAIDEPRERTLFFVRAKNLSDDYYDDIVRNSSLKLLQQREKKKKGTRSLSQSHSLAVFTELYPTFPGSRRSPNKEVTLYVCP